MSITVFFLLIKESEIEHRDKKSKYSGDQFSLSAWTSEYETEGMRNEIKKCFKVNNVVQNSLEITVIRQKTIHFLLFLLQWMLKWPVVNNFNKKAFRFCSSGDPLDTLPPEYPTP